MPELEWVEVTTIGDLLVRAAARWPDNEAILLPGDRRTYARVLAEAEQAARSLFGLGLRPGERVGILMPNCHDFVSVEFGCAMLGLPFVPINARYKAYELSHVLRDAELAAVVTSDLIVEHVDFAALLAAAVRERPPALRELILLGASSPPDSSTGPPSRTPPTAFPPRRCTWRGSA